jgi:hypothetical protein
VLAADLFGRSFKRLGGDDEGSVAAAFCFYAGGGDGDGVVADEEVVGGGEVGGEWYVVSGLAIEDGLEGGS